MSKGRPPPPAAEDIIWCALQLSVKPEKHSTRTIHRANFFKKPAKKYIIIQWGIKLRKPSILVVN
jgi:hypothetical protein